MMVDGPTPIHSNPYQSIQIHVNAYESIPITNPDQSRPIHPDQSIRLERERRGTSETGGKTNPDQSIRVEREGRGTSGTSGTGGTSGTEETGGDETHKK